MTTERKIYVNNDLDIVVTRMQVREMAKQMGFGITDQARISLAASELARFLCWHTPRPGEITLSCASKNGQRGVQVTCSIKLEHLPQDNASSGVPDISGLGRSLAGARQLVDDSTIEAPDHKQARVTLRQWLS